jgi:hypothetical protein
MKPADTKWFSLWIAALLVLSWATSASAQILPRQSGSHLVRIPVIIQPGATYVAETTGCDGTSTDTVMYLVENLSPGVVRTLKVNDDIIVPEPDGSSTTLTFCSKLTIQHPASAQESLNATLLIASYDPGSAGTVDLTETTILVSSGGAGGTSIDTTPGLQVGGARWTGTAWDGDDSNKPCKSRLMTKPLRPGGAAIRDTLMYAINELEGGIGYLDDDSGIEAFSAIEPAKTCITGRLVPVPGSTIELPEYCDVLAGSFNYPVDVGDVEIWNNRVRSSGFVPCTTQTDTDGDRVSDLIELLSGTNHLEPDPDHDGLTDYQELIGHPPNAIRQVYDPVDVWPAWPSFPHARFIPPGLSLGIDDAEVLPLDDTDPMNPDVFIEVDYMAAGPGELVNHAPYGALSTDFATIFGDSAWTGRGDVRVHFAPTSGATGARLSQELPYARRLGINLDCDDDDSDAPLELSDFKSEPAYFNPIRYNIYHYVVAGAEQTDQCDGKLSGSSGRAELWGEDVIITLGQTGLGAPLDRAQRGTHVHELGHNFSLEHNGNEDNWGANSCVHASVMNYRYQMVGWDPWELDSRPNLENFSYSRGQCDGVTGSLIGCSNTCVNGCVPPSEDSPKQRCSAPGVGNFLGCDCDANEWASVKFNFQRFGFPVAGVGDEVAALDFLAGKSAVAPSGFLEAQQKKLEAVLAAGFVEGVDFEITPLGELVSIESGPLAQDFSLLDVAVFGSDRVQLRDRAELQKGSSYASVAAGALGMTAGADAKLGSALSAGPLALGDRTHLYGLGRYTGALTQGSQVVIDGGSKQVPSLQGPDLSAYVRTFPPVTGGNIDLQPAQQLSIAPGSYGTTAIKSRARLKLAPGDYYFKTLEVLEPQARLELTQPNSPVRIHVRDKLTFRGEVTVSGSTAFPLLFLVYQGTLPARFESRFQGTVLAPAAAIVVGTTSTPHWGAFFGREVEVQAGARVNHLPFVLEP